MLLNRSAAPTSAPPRVRACWQPAAAAPARRALGALHAAPCALAARRASHAGASASVHAPRSPPRRARHARGCRAGALVPHDSPDATPDDAAPDASPPLSPSQSASVQLPGMRRRTQLDFTCNRCGERTSRLVNPEALARGTVFVQCATASCAVWHKIADAHNFYGTEYTGLQQSGGDGGAGA